MASTDSIPVPRKNTAFRLYFTVRDATGVPVTGFTSPDSEVSKDGGAFADCTNEATYVGHGNGYIDLTSTEMNADSVCYYMSCTEGNIDIAIAPEELGDVRANMGQCGGTAVTGRDIGASVLLSSGTGTGQISLSSGKVTADVDTIKTNPVVNGGTVTFPTGATLASTTNITSAAGIAVTSIATDAVSAASVAAAAVTKIQSGLATPTNITAGTITTVTNLTNAPTSGDLTATMKASVTAAVPTASSIASAVWNALSASWSAVTGSFGKLLGDNSTTIANANNNTATILDKIGTPANVSLSNDIAAVKSQTDLIPAQPAAVGSAMTLADDAISAAKIAAGAITAAKIGDDAITAAKIADDAIDAIQDGLPLKADTLTEPTAGAFPVNPTRDQAAAILYGAHAFGLTDTQSKRQQKNSSGDVIAEAPLDVVTEGGAVTGVDRGKMGAPS